MKTPSVSMLLGVCVLLLSAPTVSVVSLDVHPNLQQFFSGLSYVSLSCVDGWTVKRTRGRHTEDCGAAADFRWVNKSSCVLDLSVSSGGNFWCENSSGLKSINVYISISGGPLILEIPALPVRTGSDLTLRCKTKNGSPQKSYFFRDGLRLGYEPEGKFILSNVQRSHEGFYSCSTAIHQSSRSRLRVGGPSPPLHTITILPPPPVFDPPASSFLPSPPPPLPTNSSSPPLPSSAALLRFFRHLVVFCPYCICTVLLLSIYCSRNSGNRPSGSMEMTWPDE